jgi:hypothetical protein
MKYKVRRQRNHLSFICRQVVTNVRMTLFFLEYAGELRIIALREEKTEPYKKPPPTPARAVGVLSYNKA